VSSTPWSQDSASEEVSSIDHRERRLKILECSEEACTVKKENQIFLIYKEIQSGAVAKSYMRKGFLIYDEMRKYTISPYMRRPLVIYDFATAPL
jgi:hypothetical protein